MQGHETPYGAAAPAAGSSVDAGPGIRPAARGALEVRGVSFRHPGAARLALDGMQFHAREGTITGLLGPNGAGKTTFVSLLCGVARPQSGDILVHGLDHQSREARARIGYCPQELALYTTLTATENLRFFGKMAGIRGAELDRRVGWCLESVRLGDSAHQRVEQFSGGMQRRLNLAVSLVHSPRLLVLDEPTVGVDMQSRHAIFETLEGIAASGTAILYTTHYMEEVERLCEDVVVVDRGRVLASCTTRELLSSGINRHVFRVACDPADAEVLSRDLAARGFEAQVHDASTVAVSSLQLDVLMAAFAELTAAGRILGVDSKNPTLEERFLELTQNAEGRR